MKRKTIAIFLIILTLIFGCRAKKPIPPKVKKEIFPKVIDTSSKSLTQGKRGGSFIRADIQELDTLNIVTTRSKAVHSVLRLIFEPLLDINPLTGGVEGAIAKSYSITDDGYSILLKLNDNVRFSDGVKCTALDVIFTFEELYMNPDLDTKKTDLLKIRDKLITIDRIDDYTVKFNLPVPYRPFLYTLTNIEILPEHIIKPIIKTGGIRALNKEWGSKEGIKDVIGTGPYQIKEFKKGDYIKLKRNDYYSKREGTLWLPNMPYLDEIVELLGIDNDTKILKFQIGEIDSYDVKDFDIQSGDFETLLNNRKEGKYNFYCGGQTLKGNHFLVFNQNPDSVDNERLDVFKSRDFRRAISLLINRERIKNEVYKGYAFIDSSPERDISPYYKNEKIIDYKPEEAKNILSKIGLKDIDQDGWLDLPDGKPFYFTVLTNDDNPFRIKMGEIIVQELKHSGLNVKLMPISYDLIVTKLLDTFDWDSIIIGVEGNLDPNNSSCIWESEGSLHLWNPYQDTPHTEWEKRLDELFAIARTTWDFQKAKDLYYEYQDIVAEELPIINIVVPAGIYGIREGYGNVIPGAVTDNTIGLMPYIFKK